MEDLTKHYLSDSFYSSQTSTTESSDSDDSFKCKKRQRKSENSPNKKLIEVFLERDRLSAQNSVLEQEIMSLKAQLTAAKLSHDEARTAFNEILNENKEKKQIINKLEDNFMSQKGEISILYEKRNQLSTLLNKMLQIHFETGNRNEKLIEENKNLDKKLKEKEEKPKFIPFETVNVKELKINTDDEDIKDKCSHIKEQTQYTLTQQVQSIIDILTTQIQNKENEINKISRENAELQKKFETEKENSKKLENTISAIQKEWENIEEMEDLAGKSCFVEQNQEFLNLIKKYKKGNFESENEILQQIQESDYSNIFESIALSNKHMKRQLESAYFALEKKEKMDKVMKEIGANSCDEIVEKLEKCTNKINELKSTRKSLYLAAVAQQEDNENNIKIIEEKEERIKELLEENKNLKNKVNECEEKIKQIDTGMNDTISEVSDDYELKIEEIKKKFTKIIAIKEKEKNELTKQTFEAEKRHKKELENIEDNHNRELASYEAQIELIQNKYKEIYSESMEKEKNFKKSLKELKKQCRLEMKEMAASYKEQKESFNCLVAEMKRKSTQDLQLTEKLTNSLKESENKVRELRKYIQKIENT